MQKNIVLIITLINFASWSIASDPNSYLSQHPSLLSVLLKGSSLSITSDTDSYKVDHRCALLQRKLQLVSAQETLEKAKTLHHEKLRELGITRLTLLMSTYNSEKYKAFKLADHAETDAREALLQAQCACNDQVKLYSTLITSILIIDEEHKKKDSKSFDIINHQLIDACQLMNDKIEHKINQEQLRIKSDEKQATAIRRAYHNETTIPDLDGQFDKLSLKASTQTIYRDFFKKLFI